MQKRQQMADVLVKITPQESVQQRTEEQNARRNRREVPRFGMSPPRVRRSVFSFFVLLLMLSAKLVAEALRGRAWYHR